ITARSTASPRSAPDPNRLWRPDLSTATLHRVCELIEVTRALYELYAAARWAAKDAHIMFAVGALPHPVADDDFVVVVERFDDRVATSDNVLARAALYDTGLPTNYDELAPSTILIVGHAR